MTDFKFGILQLKKPFDLTKVGHPAPLPTHMISPAPSPDEAHDALPLVQPHRRGAVERVPGEG